MARLVIALGGNALGSNAEEQRERLRIAARTIADMIYNGHEVIVTHGNGPQIGSIRKAFETAQQAGLCPDMPFPECGAMSQGYIGYQLQNALTRELSSRGIAKSVVTVVTQVVVDPDDPAFDEPTKPIGGFLTREQADAAAKRSGYTFKEDAGRGWRRVVASPKPTDIVELGAIRMLADSGAVVIACGGGGVPVIKRGVGDYVGVDAVIDKDYAAEKLAELLEADELLILTAVDAVYLQYNTPEQEMLTSMTVCEAEQFINEGQFAPGSMLPKVMAGVRFSVSKPRRRAVIASLEHPERGTEIKE